MHVKAKPISILVCLSWSVLAAASQAADPVSPATPMAPRQLAWPYPASPYAGSAPVFVYPQPATPVPAYQPPGYYPTTQNPYLPPRSPAPASPVPVFPWPFFVPPPATAAPAAAPAPAPVAPATVPETVVKPVLTVEAQQALAQAEADVKAARTGYTLWLPAENALNAAREAAKAGDSASVLKHAQAVAELTRLGAEQGRYPSTDLLPAPQPQAESTPKATLVPTLVAPTPAAALTPAPVAAAPVTEAVPQPVLSEAAKAALAQAEADVKAARTGYTLWLPAENALNAAREAAKAGDSASVLKHAQAVADLTRLGAEQAKYASTEFVPAETLVVTTLPPALTAEADKALAKAAEAVKAARAGYTLWLPAENAFNAAQEAAKTGDSAGVLKLTGTVLELTRLGAEQAKYPSTETPVKATAKKKARKSKPKRKPAATKPPAVKAAPAPGPAPAPAAATTAGAAKVAPAVAAPVPASPKPASQERRIKPRKLCWQGGRLEVCPE